MPSPIHPFGTSPNRLDPSLADDLRDSKRSSLLCSIERKQSPKEHDSPRSFSMFTKIPQSCLPSARPKQLDQLQMESRGKYHIEQREHLFDFTKVVAHPSRENIDFSSRCIE
jgi:hypothetical protein